MLTRLNSLNCSKIRSWLFYFSHVWMNVWKNMFEYMWREMLFEQSFTSIWSFLKTSIFDNCFLLQVINSTIYEPLFLKQRPKCFPMQRNNNFFTFLRYDKKDLQICFKIFFFWCVYATSISLLIFSLSLFVEEKWQLKLRISIS